MILDTFSKTTWIAIASLLLLTGCGTLNQQASQSRPGWKSDIPIGGTIRLPSHLTPEQAAAEITSRSVLLLGTPYRFGGSHPSEGLDCSGLIAHVLQDAFRIRPPRNTEEQSLVGIPVSRHRLVPGDLVFFNTLGKSNSHVGVYLGNSRFVHAPTSRGVVRIESLQTDYWAKRFDQARRLIAQLQ